MIDSMMYKIYTNQIDEKIAMLDKKFSFLKFNTVDINKSPRQIQTRDLGFASPIP